MTEIHNTAKHGIYDTVVNGESKVRVTIPAGETFFVQDGAELGVPNVMPLWVYNKFMQGAIAKRFKKIGALKIKGEKPAKDAE